MPSRKEYKEYSEGYYTLAKKCYNKGINLPDSDMVNKVIYLSSAIEFLLVSNDLLINWLLLLFQLKKMSLLEIY